MCLVGIWVLVPSVSYILDLARPDCHDEEDEFRYRPPNFVCGIFTS